MSGTVDRTQQLVEADRNGRFAQKASLQAVGVPLPQHNAKTTKAAAKKAAPEKAPTKKAAPSKPVAKKTATKSTAKKAAKKS